MGNRPASCRPVNFEGCVEDAQFVLEDFTISTQSHRLASVIAFPQEVPPHEHKENGNINEAKEQEGKVYTACKCMQTAI